MYICIFLLVDQQTSHSPWRINSFFLAINGTEAYSYWCLAGNEGGYSYWCLASMDWFCWETFNRKPWFLPLNMWFSCKFPLNQSIDSRE